MYHSPFHANMIVTPAQNSAPGAPEETFHHGGAGGPSALPARTVVTVGGGRPVRGGGRPVRGGRRGGWLVVSGESGRDKHVEIGGVSPEAVRAALGVS